MTAEILVSYAAYETVLKERDELRAKLRSLWKVAAEYVLENHEEHHAGDFDTCRNFRCRQWMEQFDRLGGIKA